MVILVMVHGMVAQDCPPAELTSRLPFPVSLLEVYLLSKAARPRGKHAQLLGSFSNLPSTCVRIKESKTDGKKSL